MDEEFYRRMRELDALFPESEGRDLNTCQCGRERGTCKKRLAMGRKNKFIKRGL